MGKITAQLIGIDFGLRGEPVANRQDEAACSQEPVRLVKEGVLPTIQGFIQRRARHKSEGNEVQRDTRLVIFRI